jgi:hypothetical protein
MTARTVFDVLQVHLFWSLDIVVWDLFDICFLVLVIFTNFMKMEDFYNSSLAISH